MDARTRSLEVARLFRARLVLLLALALPLLVAACNNKSGGY